MLQELKQELEYYKNIFVTNEYSINIIKETIGSIEMNMNKKKKSSRNIRRIYMSISYYGECSMVLANKMRKIIQTPAKCIIFRFKAGNRISSFFSRIFPGANDKKKIIYGYSYYDCEGHYIGQISRGADVRKEEYRSLLGEKVTPKLQNTALIEFIVTIRILIFYV